MRLDLPEGSGHVSLAVYDVRGRKVKALANGHLPAGRHSLIWKGTDDTGRRVSAGVYYVRLETASIRETYRVTVLK